MHDTEQQQRERAYRIWEDEGRPEGAQDDHWHRAARPDDLGRQESDDVTKANQEADDAFATEEEGADSAADIRPPSSVAPD